MTMFPVSMIPYYQHQAPATTGFIPSQNTAFTAVKPSKRRVSFTPTVRVKTVSKLSSTPEDKSRLYYTKKEMTGFYLDVKEFYSSCKENITPDAKYAMSRQCLVRLEADPALRGLELFFYPIRIRNKAFARKSLLKYYRDLKGNPNMTHEKKVLCLAAASAKLSQWSKLVARETARLDSWRAYDISRDPPQHFSCAPKTVDSIPAIEKRTVSFDEDDIQPSKRRRKDLM